MFFERCRITFSRSEPKTRGGQERQGAACDDETLQSDDGGKHCDDISFTSSRFAHVVSEHGSDLSRPR